MHDALAGRAPGVQRDAELLGVGLQRLHLAGADLVGHRTVGRRHVVVHRGDGEIGAAHGAPVQAEALERLRARHLVHEVEIDVEQVGLAVGSMHDVALPHLLGQRLGHRCASSGRLELGGGSWPSASGCSIIWNSWYRYMEHEGIRCARHPEIAETAAGVLDRQRGGDRRGPARREDTRPS